MYDNTNMDIVRIYDMVALTELLNWNILKDTGATRILCDEILYWISHVTVELNARGLSNKECRGMLLAEI
jgi:hypothetical protein